jgi:hypothetical protein
MGKNKKHNHSNHGKKVSSPEAKESEASAPKNTTSVVSVSDSTSPDTIETASNDTIAEKIDTSIHKAATTTDKEARWEEAEAFAAQVQAEEEAAAVANEEVYKISEVQASGTQDTVEDQDEGRLEARRRSEERAAQKILEIRKQSENKEILKQLQEQEQSSSGEAWEIKANEELALLGNDGQSVQQESWEVKASNQQKEEDIAIAIQGLITTDNKDGLKDTREAWEIKADDAVSEAGSDCATEPDEHPYHEQEQDKTSIISNPSSWSWATLGVVSTVAVAVAAAIIRGRK